MIDLTFIIKLTNDINLIQQMRWKLTHQNEMAAEALDELDKIVSALCKPSLSLWQNPLTES